MEEIKIEEINLETGEPIMSENTENTTFTSFVNSLSDLLLNHDDFNYNIVRSAAERVDDDFDIDKHIDLDEVRINVQENLDMYDLANSLEDYLDYDEMANKVIRELDFSEVASETKAYLDIEDDIDDRANYLLNSYDPESTCSTGNAFTQAIAKALQYMMYNSEQEEFEVMQFLMNRNAIVVERTVDSDRNVVAETVVENNQQEDDYEVADLHVDDNDGYEAALVQTGTDENGVAVMSEMKVPNDDFIYNLMKRIVNDLLSEYVSSFDTDPFMRIRMEAKAFDIYHEMKG